MPGTDLGKCCLAATKLVASSSEFDVPRKVAEETVCEIMVQFNTQKHVARRLLMRASLKQDSEKLSAWQLPKTSSIFKQICFM
jgi:hypothetical protein